MTDHKKLIEELRRGLDALERAYGSPDADDAQELWDAHAALSQLEAILNEVGGLAEKWETEPMGARSRTDIMVDCAAELRTALQGGESSDDLKRKAGLTDIPDSIPVRRMTAEEQWALDLGK